jgi:hypothetical protein
MYAFFHTVSCLQQHYTHLACSLDMVAHKLTICNLVLYCVCNTIGLCDEIVQLFDASSIIDENCKTVVNWAENMHVSNLHIILLYRV